MDRIYSYSDFEKRRSDPYLPDNYNLKAIQKILDLLGHPERHFLSFHVAGTKGKGTTTFLLAYLLEAMGYRTGHTVSPHLIDERDRFYLRGNKVLWKDLIAVLEEVLEAVDRAEKDEGITPTLFDIYTATAFQLFFHAKVDVAIVETGMGGRWDSTNCLRPSGLVACLITLIDYDHVDKLGDTLSLIAGEKAGIIKPGIPVFTLNNNTEVKEVIQEKAKGQGSPVYFIHTPHPLLNSLDRITKEEQLGQLSVPIQVNLNLAVECLTTMNYPLKEEHIRTALKELPIPGRYQKIENLLIDGAHTPHSLNTLISTIRSDPQYQHFEKIKMFFYCLYDKDVFSLVREIPFEWELFFFDCCLPYVKQKKVMEVKKKADQARGRKLEIVTRLGDLRWQDHPQTLHVFTGSFKLVGKVLGEVKNIPHLRI